MAIPLPFNEEPLEVPPWRGTLVAVIHEGPPAIVYDHYIGGNAREQQVIYTNINHYVWWSDQEPAPL